MDGQFVPEPTANLNGGTFPAGTTLSLSGNLSNGRSIWYTLNGTDPRFTSNTTVLNTKTLVDITAPAKALVPTSNIGTNWRGGNEPFDDSSWIGGTNGVGFDSASTYNPYININLEAPNPVMSGVNTSAYVRIPFNIAAGDIAKFNYLTLQMRYDDGFVAFLNGTRIASGLSTGILVLRKIMMMESPLLLSTLVLMLSSMRSSRARISLRFMVLMEVAQVVIS